MRLVVQPRLDGITRLDDTLYAEAVGKLEREPPRRLVPLGAHAQELRQVLVVEEPAVSVDEPEAPVARHPAGPELYLVRVDDVESLYRRDGNACDPALHAAKPSY